MAGTLLFPAVFALLVVLVILEQFSFLSLLCLLLWSIRLVCLRRPKLLLTSFIVGLAIFGRTLSVVNDNQTILNETDTHFLVAVHPESVKVDGDRLQFYGQIKQSGDQETKENIVVFYTLQSEQEKNYWNAAPFSNNMAIEGNLEVPRSQRNPHQFDYASFLKQKQIHWTLSAAHIQPLVKETDQSSFLLLQPSKWRSALLDYLDQHVYGRALLYMKRLLFGETKEFEGSVREQYQKLGIIHLLSISGLHIHLLINGLEWLLLRLGMTKERIPLLFLVFLPVYGTLAGWGTSVFRAVFQSWFVFVGQTLSYRIRGIDAWAITLILACLIQPYQIYSVGFQLSYGLSICLMLTQNAERIRQLPAFSRTNANSMVLSLVSIPVLSFHFFEFPWISVAANSVFVPLFSWFILPSIILLCMASFLIPHTSLLVGMNQVLNTALLFLEQFIERVSRFPYLTFVTGRLPIGGMLLLCAGILIVFYVLDRKRKHTKKLVFTGILCILLGLQSQRCSPLGKVVLIDVGQGDSILIKQPFQRPTVLIDTGGQHIFDKEAWQERAEPYSIGKDIVLPVLKSYGIDTLDQIVLTHGDIDHTGSLADISGEIQLNELILSKGSLENRSQLTEQVSKLQSKGTEIRFVQADMEEPVILSSGLGVLWPFEEGSGENDDSIVLYGKIGTLTWLFTGDIEEESEQAFLKKYPGIRADVLKVAHHGSQTSTTQPFLKTVTPRYGLISCGKNNWYGHPHQSVVERLEKNGTMVWRTDEQGAFVYSYYPWE